MLILLDRDGVLNRDLPDVGVVHPEQFEILPRVGEAVAKLNRAGHVIAVVTNQSAVGKGLLTLPELEKMHARLQAEIRAAGGKIAEIFFCTDHPDRPTWRRKPNPGMVQEAMEKFKTPPSNTIFIGDALRDLQAAHAAGCRSILVRSGKGIATINHGIPVDCQPVAICDDLWDAAAWILEHISR